MVIPGPSFDPKATLQAVEAEKCTSLYGVPTMFIAELADPDFESFDLSSLRTGIMAGSPCPVEVMKQVIEQMGMSEVSICYGMTETSPVSLQTRSDDTIDQRVSTVGHVGPHLEVKIVDPATGLTVPRGEPGELCTRGYSVMLGYWNNPEKTAEAIDAGRWMHTGDIGVMDSDGYVAITGRIKDMVIRGGENVYPREIEEFLYTHPDILDAQVIGVPDAKYGEELMVWVRMKDGAEPLDAASGARVLHRQARPLQDPEVRARRRRVPDDRDRQGAQGRDARAVPRPDRAHLIRLVTWCAVTRRRRAARGVRILQGRPPSASSMDGSAPASSSRRMTSW